MYSVQEACAAIIMDPRTRSGIVMRNAITEQQEEAGFAKIKELATELAPIGNAPHIAVPRAAQARRPLLLRDAPAEEWSLDEEIRAFKSERPVSWETSPLDWWKLQAPRYRISYFHVTDMAMQIRSTSTSCTSFTCYSSHIRTK